MGPGLQITGLGVIGTCLRAQPSREGSDKSPLLGCQHPNHDVESNVLADGGRHKLPHHIPGDGFGRCTIHQDTFSLETNTALRGRLLQRLEQLQRMRLTHTLRIQGQLAREGS